MLWLYECSLGVFRVNLICHSRGGGVNALG